MPLQTSPEINALIHPFRTFAAEAARARANPATTIAKKLSLSVRRPLLFLVVMGWLAYSNGWIPERGTHG